jgi:hypothetical protein
MTLIDIITSIFKENMEKFPGQMGKDNAAIASEIKRWHSELSLKNVSADQLSLIHDLVAKDARFVTKPAELSDYFAVKLLLDIIDDIGSDDITKSLIEEVKKLDVLFSHRYGYKWKSKSLEQDIERLTVWIKELKLNNVDPSSIEAAAKWVGTKSDYNRYAPTVQDFVLACRMAMIGEDVPSPKEAYMIIMGMTKRKSHPLVDWTLSQVKVYESKHSKAIPQEIYLTLYQDALYEFGATGEIPTTKIHIESDLPEDKSDTIGKEDLLNIIKKIQQEI